MKRLFAAALVLITVSAHAGDYSVTVTNTMQILPAAGLRPGLTPWVAETVYTNGQTAGANGHAWMCLIPGTSGTSNGPSGIAQITEGSVKWVPITQPRRGGWYLKNLSANTRVMKGTDKTVSSSTGYALDYLDAIVGGSAWQDGIFVNATNSSIVFGEQNQQ